MNEKEIINKIFDYLSDYIGEEISTMEIVEKVYGKIEFNELEHLDSIVRHEAIHHNLYLDDSEYKGMLVGSSSGIPYVIRSYLLKD